MRDYSPLFTQGLFAAGVDSAFRAVPRIQPRRRSVVGRSFLNFQPSVYVDEDAVRPPLTPMSATSFGFSTRSSKQSISTSPSRRALPLPKPAPLSSLPAIPISTASSFPSRPSSPVPSSHFSLAPSKRQSHRKHTSLSASFFSARSHLDISDVDSMRTVSSTYRKRKRQDALFALEGRSRLAATRSFVPSVLQEDDEDVVDPQPPRSAPPTKRSSRPLLKSHLSFSSTLYPIMPSTKADSDPISHPIFSASSSSRRPSLIKSPTTPCFSVSYAPESVDSTPRRASTGNGKIGWGINFIDLEDDSGASSVWRWSHVA